jgi:hypothetical protein
MACKAFLTADSFFDRSLPAVDTHPHLIGEILPPVRHGETKSAPPFRSRGCGRGRFHRPYAHNSRFVYIPGERQSVQAEASPAIAAAPLGKEAAPPAVADNRPTVDQP